LEALACAIRFRFVKSKNSVRAILAEGAPRLVSFAVCQLHAEAHDRAPKEIVLDLDATDDPLHGHQDGRFFHGYYDCHCYLPLYVFCGRHLLAAKLRRANIDAAAGAGGGADRRADPRSLAVSEGPAPRRQRLRA
jgi:hypothetical protein